MSNQGDDPLTVDINELTLTEPADRDPAEDARLAAGNALAVRFRGNSSTIRANVKDVLDDKAGKLASTE